VRRLLVAVLASAVAVLAAAPASAQVGVVDDDPAVAAQGTGDMRVFIRGRDNALWTRSWNGTAWSAWSSLGGSLTSGPAAMARPGGIYDVFVRGPDRAMWIRTFTPAGGWTPWASLGGAFLSGPGATYRQGTGEIDVFGVGVDNQLYHSSYAGSWSPWGGLGCCVVGAPSVESPGSGVLDVWVRSTNQQLYQKYWTPQEGWVGYIPLGGELTSTPEGTAWAGDRRDVFVRGPDSVVYDKSWTQSGGWGPFVRMPGVIDSAPAATALAPGVLQLFARGSIGLVANAYNGSWSGWQNFSEIPPTPPAPAPAPASPTAAELRLRAGFGCIPVGGRVPVRVRVYQRNGRLKPRVIKVVFFIDRGKRRRVDRHKPYKTRIRVTFKRGSRHRIHARIFFRRKGHKRVQRKTISKRFTMCSGR
jgi:hypothetical protein